MPKVRVPRTHITPDEVIAVLGRRLGAGYEVGPGPGRAVRVRRQGAGAAVVHIRDGTGVTVFRVRGGGLPLLRIGSTFTIARRVAGALRQSAEFRSL